MTYETCERYPSLLWRGILYVRCNVNRSMLTQAILYIEYFTAPSTLRYRTLYAKCTITPNMMRTIPQSRRPWIQNHNTKQGCSSLYSISNIQYECKIRAQRLRTQKMIKA